MMGLIGYLSKQHTIKMLYVGIDPGLSGAIGVIDNKDKFLSVFDAPIITQNKSGKKKKQLSSNGIVAIISEIIGMAEGIENIHVTIEKAIVMPQIQGRNGGQGTVSAFNFGYGAGIYEGVFAAMGVSFNVVFPATWKKEVFNNTGLGANKEFSIILAQQFYPEAKNCLKLKKHDGRAEAILLAGWGRSHMRLTKVVGEEKKK